MTMQVQPTGTDIITYGSKFLGVPYLWGGTSPKGFDCSGLVVYIYKHFGISLPRTSQEQAHVGVTVPSSQIQPGDLLFYNTTGTDSHVALYAGNGMQLVARHRGLPVQFQKVGSFTHAQRILQNPGPGVSGGLFNTTPTGQLASNPLDLPSPQTLISDMLSAIGVPDLKDLLERLGFILLGGGLVIVGIYLLNKGVTEKLLGSAKETVKSTVGVSKTSETSKNPQRPRKVKGDSSAAVT